MSLRISFRRIRKALRKIKKLREKKKQLSTISDNLRYNVIKDEDERINEQVAFSLEDKPVEVLKAYRSGARLSPLSSYTLRDVDLLSEYQLSQIRGIGRVSAERIKQALIEYKSELRNQTKLILSNNDRTFASSSLVRDLYIIDELNKVKNQTNSLWDQYVDEDLDSVISKANIAANPFRWIFASKNEKEDAENAVEIILNILDSPVVTEIEALSEKRSKRLKAEHNEYWNAFVLDPARLYAVLDNVHENSGVGAAPKNKYLPDLSPEIQQQVEKTELNTTGLKCVLRPYQEYGVKFILSQRNVLLGDEMGLGKTIEAIAAMVSLRNNGSKYFLVICPASVLINWEREINRHSDLNGFVLHGANIKSKLDRWEAVGGVAITNYESTSKIKTDKQIDFTVVDEAHYIKNQSSIRTQNTCRLMNRSSMRLLMSGTPLENKIDEMNALIGYLRPDIVTQIRRLSAPITPNDYKETVAPVYYRRTKDFVWKEMPQLQVSEEIVEMTDEEKHLYAALFQNKSRSSFEKMRQISFEVDCENSSKLNRIKELCDEAKINNRKVIIFSFYLNTIERIKEYVGNSVFGPITGAVAPEERQRIIDNFSEYDGGAVLLSQITAGGTGLNIQKASVIIICEPQYKPSVENQAIARAYRIGQMSNVSVYRMICQNSVDEIILQVLKEKQRIFDEYADKSISGENDICVNESEITRLAFEQIIE